MKIQKILSAFACALFILVNSSSVNAGDTAFSQENFDRIKQQHLGKQWLMLLWSVDCPPCFKELALIQKIRLTKPDIAIVIVNVDDNDDVAQERKKVLDSYGLTTLESYYFSDGQGDRSRYLIDPSWFGELPRSYFIESNGRSHGRSGLVKEELLVNWLKG